MSGPGRQGNGPPPATTAALGSVTVTNQAEGGGGGQERPCRWCGRRFVVPAGSAGRPRLFCRRSCRQRDFEARSRGRELGLAEDQIVLARRELSRLDDLLYVLACAVEDVEGDLAGEHDDTDVRRALDWLLDAARPLAEMSGQGRLAASRAGGATRP